MPQGFEELRVLLVQVRAEKLAAVRERQCVLEMTGLDLTQLDSVNVTAVDGNKVTLQSADGKPF